MVDGETKDFGAPEYLGYKMLEYLYEVDNRPVSRSKFWKLCCMADRRLMEQDNLDIGFPRYWYKYGEISAAHDMSREFFNAPSARFWAGQEFHLDREIPEHEFDVSPQVRETIKKHAKNIADRFGKSSVEEIKAYQYSRQAPNSFIEEYSRLRAQFEAVNLNRQALFAEYTEGGTEGFFMEKLDKMLDTFPRSRYSDVLDLYLRWDDTIRLMIEANADFQDLHDFLDFFIERLSEITLRFEHNSNIPRSRLNTWSDEKPSAEEEMEKRIEEVRQEYLLKTEQSGELERIADEYDELVSRNL